MKVCFFYSGAGNSLQVIAHTLKRHDLGFQIAGVVTDRDCGALDVARSLGIRAVSVPFREFEDRAQLDDAFVKAAMQFGSTAAHLNFNLLVGKGFLDSFEGCVSNTHFSLLPAFKGFGGVRRALNAGVRYAGISVHQVTMEYDAGPIVVQGIASIAAKDNPATLGLKLFKVGCLAQLQALSMLAKGQFDFKTGALNDALASALSYELEEVCPNLPPHVKITAKRAMVDLGFVERLDHAFSQAENTNNIKGHLLKPRV